MKTRRVVLYAIVLLPSLFLSASTTAQLEATELQVGVFPVEPFVMEQNGTLTGFSINLWNEIAARLKVKSTYHVVADVTALTDDLRAKRVDLVASPVFITSARDEEFDFSHTIMDAGLGILVRGTGDAARRMSPLHDLLQIFLSPTIFVWLGVGLLLILIPAHIIWFLDRRHPAGIVESERYFPGIFHAMFWAASALVSQVQGVPGQWLARVIALIWMFGGVVFVAFYTAQLTSTLTVQKIQGAIEGPADLAGKQVGTIANSVAFAYLQAHNAQVQGFVTPDLMYKALLVGRVDAVVFGAPVLLYYASHQGSGLVRVVGPQFNTLPVAMLFPAESPLRKRVDTALTALRENGTYQRLYDKWFVSK